MKLKNQMNLSNSSGVLAAEKTSGFFILHLQAFFDLNEALPTELSWDSCDL